MQLVGRLPPSYSQRREAAKLHSRPITVTCRGCLSSTLSSIRGRDNARKYEKISPIKTYARFGTHKGAIFRKTLLCVSASINTDSIFCF